MTLTAGGEVFPHLIPRLIGPQELRIELIRDSLDGYLHICQFRVVEGIGIASKGLLLGLKENGDPLILRAGTLMLKFQRVSLELTFNRVIQATGAAGAAADASYAIDNISLEFDGELGGFGPNDWQPVRRQACDPVRPSAAISQGVQG